MNDQTKLVPCAYNKCGDRRAHWCDPFTPRGTQQIEVSKDFEGDAYCSIECAVYAGKMSVRAKNSHEQLLEAMNEGEQLMTPG